MARGGKRPGAGRKKGNSTRERVARAPAIKKLTDGKTTPLDYLVQVMRGDVTYDEQKFKAAVAAAPYMHPRLQAIEHSGEIVSKHEQAVDELERAAGITAIAANGSSDSEVASHLDELEERVLN